MSINKVTKKIIKGLLIMVGGLIGAALTKTIGQEVANQLVGEEKNFD